MKITHAFMILLREFQLNHKQLAFYSCKMIIIKVYWWRGGVPPLWYKLLLINFIKQNVFLKFIINKLQIYWLITVKYNTLFYTQKLIKNTLKTTQKHNFLTPPLKIPKNAKNDQKWPPLDPKNDPKTLLFTGIPKNIVWSWLEYKKEVKKTKLKFIKDMKTNMVRPFFSLRKLIGIKCR